ncbi:MAG: diaminopimelate decarboxylase, partial [Pseudomonadota bacterium]
MNRWFHFVDGQLHVEGVPAAELAANFGTPLYVYSRNALLDAFGEYQQAMPSDRGLVCFAVKANSGRAVLATLAGAGAGFDIVSGGELERVLAAGGDPGRVIFSGVGKSTGEMRQALTAGIRCFNIESEEELERLNAVALELGVTAPVSLRLNPDVSAGGHRYIATGGTTHKFGVPGDACLALAEKAHGAAGIEFTGLAC